MKTLFITYMGGGEELSVAWNNSCEGGGGGWDGLLNERISCLYWRWDQLLLPVLLLFVMQRKEFEYLYNKYSNLTNNFYLFSIYSENI